MTIKKRLFLSNILMIVIPACLGVLAVAAALLLFLTVLLPQSGSTWLSQHDMAETRSELVSLAEDWLSEADPAQQTALAARLEKTAAAHQMVLVIRQDGGEAGRFGQGAATDQPGLTQALAGREMLSHITTIDVSSATEIVMSYENRLSVKLYNNVDFDRKLRALEQIVAVAGENGTGSINMKANDRVIWTQGG